MSKVRPGFYPDGTGVDRWWDGAAWTDDTRAPLPVRAPAYPPPYTSATRSTASVDGAVTAGWWLAILLSPLGFFVGLFLIGKSPDAGKIIGLSVVVMGVLYAWASR